MKSNVVVTFSPLVGVSVDTDTVKSWARASADEQTAVPVRTSLYRATLLLVALTIDKDIRETTNVRMVDILMLVVCGSFRSVYGFDAYNSFYTDGTMPSV